MLAGQTALSDAGGGKVDGKVCETADVPVSFKSDVWEHLSSPPPRRGKGGGGDRQRDDDVRHRRTATSTLRLHSFFARIAVIESCVACTCLVLGLVLCCDILVLLEE